MARANSITAMNTTRKRGMTRTKATRPVPSVSCRSRRNVVRSKPDMAFLMLGLDGKRTCQPEERQIAERQGHRGAQLDRGWRRGGAVRHRCHQSDGGGVVPGRYDKTAGGINRSAQGNVAGSIEASVNARARYP